MTFLDLVQSTWLKCGLSGAPPQSVKNTTDMEARVVLWVQDAYREVQQAHDHWLFMAKTAISQFVPGKTVYSWADLNAPDLSSLWQVDAGHGSPTVYQPMTAAPFEELAAYVRPTEATRGAPLMYAVGFDKRLHLAAPPQDPVPVRVQYFHTPVEFVNNTDLSILPEGHNHVIRHRAVQSYAFFDSDPALMQEALRSYSKALFHLENQYLPPMRFPRPALLDSEVHL